MAGAVIVGRNPAKPARAARLTEALRNNEGWAVAEVSKRIEPIIRNKIYAFDDWEDVLQQSLMEVVAAVKACETVTNIWGLARRVAVTTVIDHNRAHRRSRDRTERGTGGTRGVSGGEPENRAARVPDRRSRPDAVVESRDLFVYIYQRIGKKCRRIIDLVYIEGITYERAATEMGLTEGTLRVTVHRCRERARRLRAEALQVV
jgi:RNA polymerase sigma factor (sigma-70 family)